MTRIELARELYARMWPTSSFGLEHWDHSIAVDGGQATRAEWLRVAEYVEGLLDLAALAGERKGVTESTERFKQVAREFQTQEGP